MNRPSFDKEVLKAWSIARTREPEKIKADIAKEEGKQAVAVRDTVTMTVAATVKAGFKKKAEEIASDGVNKIVVAKQRQKFDAAAKRLAELDAELVVSESWRK